MVKKFLSTIAIVVVLIFVMQSDSLCKAVEINDGPLTKYKDIDSLVGKRRFREAEALCKKRVLLNPEDYIAIAQLGEIYWHTDKRKGALKLFKKAVRLAPDYPYGRFLLGRSYFFQHKYKGAVKEFNIFKERMESLPEMDEETIDFYVLALHNICYMYSSLKRYDMIARECERIIELKPSDQSAHYNLAICYYNYYHNRPGAYKELQKVIEIDHATPIAERAKFFIDYMRRNPDSRVISDFSFILEED